MAALVYYMSVVGFIALGRSTVHDCEKEHVLELNFSEPKKSKTHKYDIKQDLRKNGQCE
jgi:hypothetical protein